MVCLMALGAQLVHVPIHVLTIACAQHDRTITHPTHPPMQKLYRNPHHHGVARMVNPPTHRAHRLVNMRRVLGQLELHPCMPLEQLWRVGDLANAVQGAAHDVLEDIARAMQQRWGGRGYSGRVRLCDCDKGR